MYECVCIRRESIMNCIDYFPKSRDSSVYALILPIKRINAFRVIVKGCDEIGDWGPEPREDFDLFNTKRVACYIEALVDSTWYRITDNKFISSKFPINAEKEEVEKLSEEFNERIKKNVEEELKYLFDEIRKLESKR